MSARVLRSRFLIREVDERCGARELELMSVSMTRGVVLRSSLTEDEPRADDLSNYKVCLPGDIVVNRMSAYQGALGMAEQSGIVSPDYIVFRPVGNVSPRWLHHVMRSTWFVAEMASRIRGIGSIGTGNVRTPRVSAEEIGEIRVRVPDKHQQRAIANYLDAETARIDALIAKKQRMVALFDERLQAVRRHCFRHTFGWRLKHLLRAPMAYGILVPQFVEPGDGIRMLRITNLDSQGRVQLSDVAWVPATLSAEYRRTIVRSGDIVVSVVGSMGRAAVISDETDGANLNRALARVRPRVDLDPWLLWHWTQTSDFLDQARLATGGGTAQPTLNLGDLAEFRVGLPAEPSEWSHVTEVLSDAMLEYQTITGRVWTQIELLREHRRALITAAVTGELEIPGVAA